MNEVDKHYAGVDDAKTSRRSPRGSSDRASGTLDSATDWGRDTLRSASRAASGLERQATRQFDRGFRGAENFVTENPIMIGVVGLAAGFLVGSLLPSTRKENQVFGRYADEVRDQGLRYARELAEQGKSYVEENLERAKSAAADVAEAAAGERTNGGDRAGAGERA